MKIAMMYAGQGTQKAGMGKDMYEKFDTYRATIDSLDLDFDLKEVMFEDKSNLLDKTEYTQPCMSAHFAAVTNVLKENYIFPEAALGLSLGEFGAFYSAGIYDANTYVKLLEYRGKVMMEATGEKAFAMKAVLGMSSDEINRHLENVSEYGYVKIANYNCPGQYVICGDKAACEKAAETLLENGAKKIVDVKVSGPFHTKYMEVAGEKLRSYLETINLKKPEHKLVLNLTGEYLADDTDIKENMKLQLQNSVLLEKSLIKLLEDDFDTFIEIGPGKALSGFLKRTAKALGRDVKILSIETAADVDNLLKNQI